MKNRVLRLAIVALLVVAMVLTMAACGEDPVNPTPTPGPEVTTTPTPDDTSKPDETAKPPVGSDESQLESKYGITFPEFDGKLAFDSEYATYNVAGEDNFGDYKLVAKKNGTDAKIQIAVPAPFENQAYDAFLNQSGSKQPKIEVNVEGTAANGDDIDVVIEQLLMDGKPAPDGTNLETKDQLYFVPAHAGTYVVEYTIEFSADAKSYGFYAAEEIEEEYTVVKTYEVAKMNVEVEAVSDVFYVKTVQTFPAAPINVVEIDIADDAVLNKSVEDFIVNSLRGEDGDYNLSVGITTPDLAVADNYPLELSFTFDGAAAEASDLVSNDFNATFTNGTRYVFDEADQATFKSSMEALNRLVNKYTDADTGKTEGAVNVEKPFATTDDLKLFIATYEGLESDIAGALAVAAYDADPSRQFKPENKLTANTVTTQVAGIAVQKANLERSNLVIEAKELYEIYLGKQYSDAAKNDFIAYMLGLGRLPTVPGLDSDYAYVSAQIAEPKATEIVDTYVEDMLEAFTKSVALSKTAMFEFIETINQSTINAAEKALASVVEKYDDLPAHLKTGDNETALLAEQVMYYEMSTRFETYTSIIEGLDSYIHKTGALDTKATLTAMGELTGFNFDASAKNVNVPQAVWAPKTGEGMPTLAELLFTVVDVKTGAIPASADVTMAPVLPILLTSDVATAQRVIIDSYIALDDAIVAAQKDIISKLGTKITGAVATPDGTLLGFTLTGATVDALALPDAFASYTPAGADTQDGFVFHQGEQADALSVLESLKKYIAEFALLSVVTLEDIDLADGSTVTGVKVPFVALEDDSLTVVIEEILTEAIENVDQFIEDYNGKSALNKATDTSAEYVYPTFTA